ncbi:hypothetical protein EDB89DRAFT_106420 [Lactarius sanguifluus]|nr:hypothetical protein EDB89DRAFT_106420 [Lactarius sanguifluus]
MDYCSASCSPIIPASCQVGVLGVVLVVGIWIFLDNIGLIHHDGNACSAFPVHRTWDGYPPSSPYFVGYQVDGPVYPTSRHSRATILFPTSHVLPRGLCKERVRPAHTARHARRHLPPCGRYCWHWELKRRPCQCFPPQFLYILYETAVKISPC